MQADLAGFFSRLKGRGNGPRLRRAKQNRTKKLPSCSRYLIKIFLQHYRCLIEPTNNKLKAICRFSLLLVLSLAPRGFSPGSPIFPLLKNKHFQISMGHFRVPKTLTFKTRLSAKTFLVRMTFTCMRLKKSLSH